MTPIRLVQASWFAFRGRGWLGRCGPGRWIWLLAAGGRTSRKFLLDFAAWDTLFRSMPPIDEVPLVARRPGFEVVDDATAEVLRGMTKAEPLAVGLGMWKFAAR
jgi:hypothetical protein